MKEIKTYEGFVNDVFIGDKIIKIGLFLLRIKDFIKRYNSSIKIDNEIGRIRKLDKNIKEFYISIDSGDKKTSYDIINLSYYKKEKKIFIVFSNVDEMDGIKDFLISVMKPYSELGDTYTNDVGKFSSDSKVLFPITKTKNILSEINDENFELFQSAKKYNL